MFLLYPLLPVCVHELMESAEMWLSGSGCQISVTLISLKETGICSWIQSHLWV